MHNVGLVVPLPSLIWTVEKSVCAKSPGYSARVIVICVLEVLIIVL